MLIDTHFHLDLMDNMQTLIAEFKNTNVGVIAVGTTPKAYEKEKQFCQGVRNIKVGLGFHPQLVAERGQEINLFLDLLHDANYIGEIGLDFNTAHISSKEQQISCFRKIAKACAYDGNKVLSIHSVKAFGAVLYELEAAGTFQNNICILHWFTGTRTERNRAIKDGAYFSINPRMLKTKSGQETIKAIPLDRLLLETDAPFTMKFGQAGELQVELDETINSISKIRGQDVGVLIAKNSMRIWSNGRD